MNHNGNASQVGNFPGDDDIDQTMTAFRAALARMDANPGEAARIRNLANATDAQIAAEAEPKTLRSPSIHVSIGSDAEADEHLRRVLNQPGNSGQPADQPQVQVRRGDEMPLTPADVRNKQFSTTRLRPGYDEKEVDAFLDEVEAELDRLIQENEELRAKLAELLRGGKSAVPSLNSPLSDPKPEMVAPERMEPERRQPEPVMMGGMPHIEDNMDTAARVLSLAQQTADQAIADARREADEVLTKARRQAEQIIGDARGAGREPGEQRAGAGSPDHWLASPEREEPTRRG